MGADKLLIVSGTILLAVSALLGFAQHRHRQKPEAFALWRVVHAGGTAGAVQLLALAAVWRGFDHGLAGTLVAVGVVVATMAFFIGPLLRVLNWPRAASAIMGIGAVVAFPTYLALPITLFL